MEEPPRVRRVVKRDRTEAVLSIVRAVLLRDPEKLYADLERAQVLRSRELSALWDALDESLEKAAQASELAMQAAIIASEWEQIDAAKREAELNEKAEAEMPREQTKDGRDKRATKDAIRAWLLANHANEYEEITRTSIRLKRAAEHFERLASSWAFRANRLEAMFQAARSSADPLRPERNE